MTGAADTPRKDFSRATTHPHMSDHYDVIIIGTGAGGGTLAWKLAPTGKRVLLLERGDYVPREPQNWSTRAVNVEGRYNASKKDAEFNNQLQQQLVATYQRLNEDQRRMLANYRRPSTAPMAGIPADSEYVVFVIDTSGSMQENHWEAMKQHMRQILDLYPRLQGLQVMDDEGAYLFPSSAARWLSDSPERRKVIMDALEHWVTYSNSSPTEGIVRAVDDFWSREKRVSIYYLGDDFTGPSIQDALDQVARLNKDRRMRIHALGFPMPPDQPQETARRYAELMRLMCEQNGGAFVGLPPSTGHRRLPPLIPVG